MKRKNTKLDEPIVAYLGYYQKYSTPLCIHTDKELVKEYLSSHRFLIPEKYRIEKIKTTEGNLFLQYEELYLTQYENWYIPSIDIEILCSNSSNIEEEISNLLSQFKEIILASKDVKKVKDEEFSHLIESYRILSSFRNSNKILRKLEKNRIVTSSILFLEIEPYLQELRRYRDMKESKNLYRYQVEKDEFFES